MAAIIVNGYTTISTLGEGGMARVYLAENEAGEKFALKISRASVPYARETLVAEYESYQKLNHDCFPKVYDLIEDGERLVMVMDLLEGSDLEIVLEDRREGVGMFEDPEETIKVALKIMQAMSYAGEVGIVHADLKPANILINGDDVKVIDFGLATGVTTLTAEDIKEIKGTISYLSPEQADGRPLDIRSDIFSAGVMLYEMLTGKRPFDSGYDMATLYSIMYEEHLAPSKVNTKLGDIVDQVISSMLAKEPADRYKDFSSVCQALEALQGNLGADVSAQGLKVVVAPMQARGGNEDDALFAEGLTEDLIMGLNQIDEVEVPPLVSVSKHSEEIFTPELARKEFGADFLLTGTIRRAGEQIRVTMTLVETESQKIAWNQKFDSPMTDLFDLQDTISAEIVKALQTNLSPDTVAPTVTRATDNVEAYQFYLKGRSYLTRNTREDMDFARSMLERAIEADATYTLAYAGMADLHGSMWMNYIDHSDERWNSGIAMANKAIELDTSSPNGYRALGRLLHLKGKFDEAIEQLERAATIDASYGETYRTLAWACEGKGDLTQSLAWTRKCLSIDPTNQETILLQGIIHYDLNNIPQAINAFQRCLELVPDYGRAHYFLAKSLQKMGRFEEALGKYSLAERFGGQSEIILDYGWFQYCMGNTSEAIVLLERGANEGEMEFVFRLYLAIVLEANNQSEKAVENFRLSHTLAQELMDKGDTTSYPVIIKAISQAALSEDDSGELLFHQAEIQSENSGKGDVALLLARYAIMRDLQSKAEQWLELGVTWRLGISPVEAMIDPMFKKYEALLLSLTEASQAA
ncbi:protein kinase [Gemmatimonas aurantiaca]|nr:protein kinase [Gemmatimonas aurantiaca]